MKLLQKILAKLNGLHYSQEYLCCALETLPGQPRMYLVQQQRISKEITNEHLFVGYSPLVFAFADTTLPEQLELVISNHVWQPNEKIAAKDAIAILKMRLIQKLERLPVQAAFYEGTAGHHHFQSAFHQYMGKKYNQWYNKKPGNVFLHDHLYKQVQVAYALPRLVCLITVGNNEVYNLFPTDLHGQLNGTQYIISLRTGGEACKQVLATGKLVLSKMQSQAYKMVYGLGKNHMRKMGTAGDFPFSERRSGIFNLPLPQLAATYTELELLDSFVHGIHTLLLFSIVNQQPLHLQPNTLVHIHNSYASWLYKNGEAGNFLLR